MDPFAQRTTVESFNVICVTGKPYILGEAFDFTRRDEAYFRHVYSDLSGESHHRIFVFRDSCKTLIGKLKNPASALAVNRNRKAALRIAARRKFQLNAGERESECPYRSGRIVGIIFFPTVIGRRLYGTLVIPHDKRARQIVSK